MMLEKRSNPQANPDNRSAKEIQHDIQQTRADMDLALDELAMRFQPRRLLDDVVGMWRDRAVQDPKDAARVAKRVARSAGEIVRAYPVPVLLSGAALVGWLLDSRRSHGNGTVKASRTDQGGPDGDREVTVPAWAPAFEWSRAAGESEAAWDERVGRSLSAAASDTSSSPPAHRLRDTAAHLVAVSGHARRDIYTRPAPSGLGATDWQQLKDCEEVASYQGDDADDGLADKAAEAWASVKQVLGDTSTSARERARKTAELMSGYASQARGVSTTWQASAQETARRWRESVQDRARTARTSVQESARAAREAVQAHTDAAGEVARRNAMKTRRYVMEKQNSMQASVDRGQRVVKRSLTTAVDEYPLAVGAASFCAGLLIGVLMPSSRFEDKLLGEKSDALAESARETAQEAIERGQEAAAEAMAEAERQGLTSRHLVDKGRQVASAASDSAKSAIDAAQKKASDLGGSIAEVAKTATETAKSQATAHVAQAKRR